MRILFISPYVPNRIRVRPFSIIRELAKRHEVHVVALGEGEGTKAGGIDEMVECVADFRVVPHSKLRGYAQSLLALPTPHPMCSAFCWSGDMRAAVDEAVSAKDFDLIHVEHLRAAHFAPCGHPAPVVFDSVDCLTGLFSQMAESKRNPVGKLVMAEEAWKLRRYEPRMLGRFDRVIITSESEKSELASLDSGLRVDVVPNGVDTDYFAPQGARKHPHRIVFSGKMGYHPNANAAQWFANNVMPGLRRLHSDVEFVIVGSGPPPEVLRLAETPGVTVTGYVDDIRPHLDSAAVAVVPMQVAVGVQNKALEAMAMGIPVVASPVAVRPFGSGCPGIIEAESANEVADAVACLLGDPASAAEMGARARDEVIRNFSWQSSVEKLEAIYEELLAAHADKRTGGG